MGWRDWMDYVPPEDRWRGWRVFGFVLAWMLVLVGGLWLGFAVYGVVSGRDSYAMGLRVALAVCIAGGALHLWLREDPRRR